MMFRLTSLILVITLSGCAAINSEYDCPRARGMQCKSLQEVDAIVAGQTGISSRGHYFDKPYPQKPYREHEKTIEIWLAPYKDSQDVFHGERRIQARSKASYWDVRGSNVK